MELVVEPVMQIVMNYKESWKLHVEGMPDEKIPKQIMKYQPRGYKSHWPPRERMHGNVRLEEA
jgi:hypothetical protein